MGNLDLEITRVSTAIRDVSQSCTDCQYESVAIQTSIRKKRNIEIQQNLVQAKGSKVAQTPEYTQAVIQSNTDKTELRGECTAHGVDPVTGELSDWKENYDFSLEDRPTDPAVPPLSCDNVGSEFYKAQNCKAFFEGENQLRKLINKILELLDQIKLDVEITHTNAVLSGKASYLQITDSLTNDYEDQLQELIYSVHDLNDILIDEK